MLRRLSGFGLFLALGSMLGCAAGGTTPQGAGGGGSGAGAAGPATGVGGGVTSVGPGGGSLAGVGGSGGGFGECAKFSAEAQQAPAAVLFVLDRSASMSVFNKWGTAQAALVKAIDADAFDTLSLGLTAFPAFPTAPPACLPVFPGTQVYCGFSSLADVPVDYAGKDKSNAPQGVRKKVYDWLLGHGPVNDPYDSSPSYDALKSGYETLKDPKLKVDRRIAVLITDGGFSCTSAAFPTRPGYSDGFCNDWEYPTTVIDLINGARTDATAPIFTFVVGVPGSNSHEGETQGTFAVAPYSMLLALSNYAVAGSPDTVDPACDKGLAFTQKGADPAKPCHIDLSNGAAFNPDALANAITTIRGKALGCVYDLPPAPPGESIDPTLVNVSLTLNGASDTLPKRKDPSDTCEMAGCWDYNAKSQVELLGKACADVTTAMQSKVEIYVGCQTIVK